MPADRIPGYSAADMAAIAVLTRCQTETQQALQKLRAIAQLDRPKARLRYSSIERHGPGDVTAEVVNDATGVIRSFRFTKNGEGELDIEEL
jgi:hypothetical protein